MQSVHTDEFDGLRAIAVMAVLQRHFWVNLLSVIDTGVFGVQLFFVLSGFLITGILLDSVSRVRDHGSSIREELKTFYLRRFLRIFPVYYLVLAVTALLGVPTVTEYFGWHALYLTNFLVIELGKLPNPSGVFWSLAVEEQFNLLWPAIVLLTPRRTLVPIMAALILLAIVFRATTRDYGLVGMQGLLQPILTH